MKYLISVIVLFMFFFHVIGKKVIAQGVMPPNDNKVENFIFDFMYYGKDGTDDFIGWIRIANLTFGYQTGYTSWNKSASHAFDINARILFLSGGYSHQRKVGHKAYIGFGLGDLFNVQYGYAYNTRNHLLRIRSDWDIGALLDKNSFLTYMGIYAEKFFGNNQYSGYSVGLTVGVHPLTPLWIVNKLTN